MAPKFKIIYSILFFHLLYASAFSQTYLSPIIGYELTHYKESINNSYFMTPPTQNGLNLLFGLELEQKLGKKFALAFQHTWSKKHIKSEGAEWNSVDDHPVLSGLGFRYNRNTLFLKYNLAENITLGLGHTYNRYKKTGFVKSPSERLSDLDYLIFGTIPSNRVDYGIASSLSYQIAHFSIDLQYHNSYRIIEADASSPTLFLPPKAISLSIKYQFKILNAPSFSSWKRKEGCPTF